MVLEQETEDRDTAVRAMLVAHVQRTTRAAATLGLEVPARGRSRFGVPALAVTGAVLLLVIVLSAVAVQLGGGRAAPANGGEPSVDWNLGSSMPTTGDGIPQVEAPEGKLLGRWTSAGGPDQKHVIDPKGLALSWRVACTGPGPSTFGITHDGETSGTGPCGGGASVGDKGHWGPVTVYTRTTKAARWSFVVVGIPETYVTPRPVLKPTNASGASVPFCTGNDLGVRYEPVRGPKDVTEVGVGQLVLTNTSGRTCALAGHPKVRFLDGTKPLGHHTMDAVDQRSSEQHGLRPVIVAPGGKAYSQVGWYLPDFYIPNEEGPCQARTVHALRVDLGNRLAGSAQQGSFDVPIGTATACLNGAHGTDGKYGQLSSTVFVDYAAEPRK